MTQLTVKDITNLYLYGQKSAPGNLVDSSLIRPENVFTRVDVVVKDFMETGAGRFAFDTQMLSDIVTLLTSCWVKRENR